MSWCRWFVLLLCFWNPLRAHGELVLLPSVTSLLAGRTCAFGVGLIGDGLVFPLQPEAFSWCVLEGAGTVDAATGVFTAPEVDDPLLVRIEATYRQAGTHRAQAMLLVLPHVPFALVEQVLGTAWLLAYAGDQPWRDPATGLRAPGGGSVMDEPRPRAPNPMVQAGVGVPFQASWRLRPGRQLLAYREGRDLVLEDVTGARERTLTAREPLKELHVEALRPLDATAASLRSECQKVKVHLRGLAPFARHLGSPFGLARVWDDTAKQPDFLVTDPASHVIHRLTADGAASTPWGEPACPGHLDRGQGLWGRLLKALRCGFLLDPPSGPSRFHSPTFLLVEAPLDSPRGWWRCLVADTGNHVIRELRPDGTVRTLAGQAGQPGHRDGPGPLARFHAPMGLALDRDGNVHVADQGNAVLRRIDPGGRVTTLAGQPGKRGSQDGPAAQARFTSLHGLATVTMEPDGESLIVVDGHALRTLRLADGQVTTRVGVVDQPGYRQVRGDPRSDRLEALRQPCLNHPGGVAAGPGDLVFVADQGNHCVRAWSEREASLCTVAGDPALPFNRWGLVRDQLEGPLDERFAALEAPHTLVAMGSCPDGFLVSSGDSLGELLPTLEVRDALGLEPLTCSDATLTEACAVRFEPRTQHPFGRGTRRAFHYQVDFLETDGALAGRSEGQGKAPAVVAVAGQFGQRGRARVVVRCVTDQGVSTGAEAIVEVR